MKKTFLSISVRNKGGTKGDFLLVEKKEKMHPALINSGRLSSVVNIFTDQCQLLGVFESTYEKVISYIQCQSFLIESCFQLLASW